MLQRFRVRIKLARLFGCQNACTVEFVVDAGGWFDTENLWGALNAYAAAETQLGKALASGLDAARATRGLTPR